jgi:hypothetical protein
VWPLSSWAPFVNGSLLVLGFLAHLKKDEPLLFVIDITVVHSKILKCDDTELD